MKKFNRGAIRARKKRYCAVFSQFPGFSVARNFCVLFESSNIGPVWQKEPDLQNHPLSQPLLSGKIFSPTRGAVRDGHGMGESEYHEVPESRDPVKKNSRKFSGPGKKPFRIFPVQRFFLQKFLPCRKHLILIVTLSEDSKNPDGFFLAAWS